MPIGRHKLSIFRGLLLFVPLGLCLFWLWKRRPPEASEFEAALDRALAPVIEQREAGAKLGASTSTQTRLLARQLALTSVPYLAARDLELWAATRKRVALSSPLICARLWKGADELVIGAAVGDLGDEALDAYAEMLARGFALRLEQKPPPAIMAGALENGFSAVTAGLPVEQRAAFEADARRADVSDARACQLFLTLSNGAERLEPRQRADFYRALSAELKLN